MKMHLSIDNKPRICNYDDRGRFLGIAQIYLEIT